MNTEIISFFIDDELTLEGKIELVDEIHRSKPFRDETVALLQQEMLLRSEPAAYIPEKALKPNKIRIFKSLRPTGVAAAALAAIIIFMVLPLTTQKRMETPYRFVLYQPNVNKVEITGNFTNWNPVPMMKLGDSGYWECTLKLHQGEYRFSYVLNGGERLPDPTIPTRENDDFGSENTILSIGGQKT